MRIPWRKKSELHNEWVDGVGREITSAAALTDAEADAAVSSPLLYARLRSRIEAESRARRQPGDWAIHLRVARMAVPTLALITIVAAFSFRFATGGEPAASPARIPARVVSVSACDITANNELAVDACSISSDEVLAVIVNRARQEGQR